MRGAEVSIYFDYASPYAYFLAEAISGFQSRTGVEVQWLPIRLLDLSNFANGIPYSANRIRYNLADVPRGAEFYGAPFQIPSQFPIDSDGALRLALVAKMWPTGDGFPLPLSYPFAAVAIPTLTVWWFGRRRRIPRGHCVRCGYNLTGLPDARCPECGTQF